MLASCSPRSPHLSDIDRSRCRCFLFFSSLFFRFIQNGIDSGHAYIFREQSECLLEPANLDLERQNTLENSIPGEGLCIVK
jgi:hypothetical protein